MLLDPNSSDTNCMAHISFVTCCYEGGPRKISLPRLPPASQDVGRALMLIVLGGSVERHGEVAGFGSKILYQPGAPDTELTVQAGSRILIYDFIAAPLYHVPTKALLQSLGRGVALS